MSRRRRVSLVVLALLFIVVPLVEIYFIVQLGQVIGAWWTIGLLIAAGFLGSYLVRREGGRAWLALQDALATYPADEIVLFTHEGGQANWQEEGLVEEAQQRFPSTPVRHIVIG